MVKYIKKKYRFKWNKKEKQNQKQFYLVRTLNLICKLAILFQLMFDHRNIFK